MTSNLRAKDLVGSAVRWTFVVAVLTALSGLVVSPVDAQALPSISVAPSTGLVDDQTVLVQGTGFTPNEPTVAFMCRVPASFANCDTIGTDSSLGSTGPDGSINGEYAVRRHMVAPGDTVLGPALVDCVVSACEVVVADSLSMFATFPVSFAPAPPLPPVQLQITAFDDRPDSALVSLLATGVPPSREVKLHLCHVASLSACGSGNLLGTTTTDETGAAALDDVEVPRQNQVGLVSVDCGQEPGCWAVLFMSGLAVASVQLPFEHRPPVAPHIVVDPSTSLADGQVVTVHGSSFEPGAPLQALMCAPGATSVDWCDMSTSVEGAVADAQGEFTLDFPVRRDLIVDTTGWRRWVDCATETCRVLVASPQGAARADAGFAPVPNRPPASVVATDLVVDGELISARVTGADLPPDRDVEVRVCSNGHEGCELPLVVVTTDATGALSVDISMPSVQPDTSAICGQLPGCIVVLTIDSVTLASTPLVPDPVLHVEIASTGTYGPDPDQAVLKATVSCDRSTAISVVGGLWQGTISGGHSFNSGVDQSQWCHPDRPLLVFVPSIAISGSGAFGPETAQAELTVKAFHRPTVIAEAFEDVVLIDQEALAAAIRVLLADPAEVELRAELTRAILTRFWQDPRFRAEWIAAVQG